MAIQELYNKLRIKREYGLGDVVCRLSFDEVDTLMEGLRELGADTNAGNENLLAFKEGVRTEEAIPDKKYTTQAYDGLRAKAKTGKYKEAVGFIRVVKHEKKPIKLIFPSGKEQTYTIDQIEVIDRDKAKLEKRIHRIQDITFGNNNNR